LQDLKTNYAWMESYKLNSWDCSTQSTALWHILNENGINARIVASLYYDEDLTRKDHIFLLAEMDGRWRMVDATAMQIRDIRPELYGYMPIRVYNTPEEANAVWPGEYTRMDISGMKRTR